MENTAWTLPEGITVPRRYARTRYKQEKWISGFKDACDGLTAPVFDELARHQGESNARAYFEGYDAGKAYKAGRRHKNDNKD